MPKSAKLTEPRCGDCGHVARYHRRPEGNAELRGVCGLVARDRCACQGYVVGTGEREDVFDGFNAPQQIYLRRRALGETQAVACSAAGRERTILHYWRHGPDGERFRSAEAVAMAGPVGVLEDSLLTAGQGDGPGAQRAREFALLNWARAQYQSRAQLQHVGATGGPIAVSFTDIPADELAAMAARVLEAGG